MKQRVTIKDYGRPEYLDGAMMQYTVVIGEWPSGNIIAYCTTIETARKIAHALGETVIIEGPS